MMEVAIIIGAYFTVWYLVSVILKNSSVVDIGWGLGFVLVAWYAFLKSEALPSLIVAIPISIWGIRLAYHIFRRNYKKPEDFRYAAFRKQWGKSFYVRAYFQLFLFQGLLLFLISLPILFVQNTTSVKSWFLLAIGAFVWIFGFAFEAIGDAQLKKHRQNPKNKGKVMNTGLWKYTRHPNYFGEATLWWGIFLISIACGASVLAIMSPILITILVRLVSGVPLLERGLEKYEGFEVYKRSTSVFIPWFPKREGGE